MMKLTSIALLLAPAALMAQQAPAIRLINAPDGASKQVLGTVAAVRQLPDGRLLVNDVQNRQLLLLDHTLGNITVVADSTSGGASSYGIRPGGIIAYLGDSTLFIDPAGLSMFVIDPAGKIVRVASVPRSQDAPALGSNLQGTPSLDAQGRIVYRGGLGRILPAGGGKGPLGMPDFPDSAALVRVDLATRKLDTAAFFKIQKIKLSVTQTERGTSMTSEINPLPLVDDWAVLSDGSIAIVRGQDYHVDFVNPDGSLTGSPKIPFDWQRLTDEDKAAIIDSARTRMEKARTSIASGGGPAGGGRGDGMVVMSFSTSRDGDAKTSSASGGGAQFSGPPPAFVSINEMPDYRPAFSQGAAKADLDGNLWVRTSSVRAGSIGGGPIYDVINRRGEIIDRLQVPAGRQIIGFGKGGVVYMQARDDKAAWIERTHR
jgi:hypothetical protein